MGEFHKRSSGRRSFLQATGATGAAVALADLGAADPDDAACSCEHTSDRDVVVGVSDAGSVDRVERDLPDGARVKRRDGALGYLLVELPVTTSAYRRMSYQAEVAGHGDVKYTEPNYPVHALSVDPDDGEDSGLGDDPGEPDSPGDGNDDDGAFDDPGLPDEAPVDDPLLEEQYAPEIVRADVAWEKTTGSEDVTVAVVDTGTRYDHPDLREQYGETKGKNVIDPESQGEDPMPRDLAQETHGTHVSGTVAAALDNGEGVAGMCDATLLSVRALGTEGGGSLDSIVAGIRYAADQGADVINMSLGFLGREGAAAPPTLENAVNYALENGALPVAAAGNDCVERVNFPAKLDGVLAVSAIDDREELASFSNTGPEIDVTAPGVDVLSTWTQPPSQDPYGGPYNAISGTSMASPVVAGVAALGKSVDPSMSPDELRQRLKQTAVDVGLDDTEQGAGRVDAVGMVEGVAGGDGTDLGPTARASVTPTDPYVGEPVICRAIDSEDDSGYITDWEWTFGDLSSETGERAVHTYDEPGEYQVTLTVEDESGTTSLATETVTVQAGACSASPVATEEFSGTVAAGDERSTHTYGLATDEPCKLQFAIEESLDGGGGPRSRGFTLYAVQPSTDFLRTECEDEIFLRPRDIRGLDTDADLTVGAFSGGGPDSPAGDYTISVEEYGFDVDGSGGGGDVDELTASFTPATPTVPPGAAVSFDATGSAAPEGVAAYRWEFGDGTTDSGARVDHAYGQAGEYDVTLTVEDETGATATETTTVTVSNANSVPDASLSVSPTTADTGQTVSFEATFSMDLDGSIEEYRWAFGDGATGTGETATHTYTEPGDHTATLTVVDDMGATATASETVTVEGEPIDDGDGEDGDGDGDDGDDGDGENLGSCGSAVETTTQTGTVDAAGEGAAFTYDTKTVDPCEVEFSLSGPSGTDFDLYLTFDGSTPSGRNYDRRSFGYGSDETLIVEDDTVGDASTFGVYVDAYSGSGQYELTIEERGRGLGGGNDRPSAEATVDQSEVAVGGFVEFDAAGSSDPDGTIREYRWDFDDGTTETGRSVVYSYDSAGRYEAELTVVDDGGATATDTVAVTVGDPETVGPDAAFTVDRSTVDVGQEVSFDASSSTDPDGSIESYEWTFEFDATGSGQLVTHAFDLPGEYDVTLTVTDDDGLSDTATKTVEVRTGTGGGGGGGGGGGSCGDVVETDSMDGRVESTVDVARFEYATQTADPCQVTVSMSGPNGADFDLYVTTDGREAGPFDYDKSSTTPSNSERVTIEDVDADTAVGIAVDSWGGTGRCTISVEEVGK